MNIQEKYIFNSLGNFKSILSLNCSYNFWYAGPEDQ